MKQKMMLSAVNVLKVILAVALFQKPHFQIYELWSYVKNKEKQLWGFTSKVVMLIFLGKLRIHLMLNDTI
jgi:hypothetical protein